MLSFPKWIIAGAVGGIVGAAIWAGISYLTNFEVGYVAWGIGLLVGICVRMVAGENEEGFAPGLTAAVIAIGSVLVGKYAAISMLVAGMGIEKIEVQVTPEVMIASLADEIVKDRTAKGQQVAFPPGKTLDDATAQADYPPDVWQQATAKWQALGAPEQEKQLAAEREEMQALVAGFEGQLRHVGFWASFSLFDALWFFLAAATAYKLGHGNIASDDDD